MNLLDECTTGRNKFELGDEPGKPVLDRGDRF